jgi:hypothetical protein
MTVEHDVERASLGVKKTILYSLLPLTVFLIVSESACRVAEIWFPPWTLDYGWGFSADSRLFLPDPTLQGLMATATTKRTCFQEQAFRMPKPSHFFRIIFVGGSSINYAQDVMEDYTSEWNNSHSYERIVEFINAGGCGYGSHRLVTLVAEMLTYDPDLIVFYEAHNEFVEFNQMQFVRLSTLPLQHVLYRSALCRFVRDRIASFQLSSLRRQRNREILGTTPRDNGGWEEKKFPPEEIRQRMIAYEQNLTRIVALCREHNVPLVLSSVPSNPVLSTSQR